MVNHRFTYSHFDVGHLMKISNIYYRYQSPMFYLGWNLSDEIKKKNQSLPNIPARYQYTSGMGDPGGWAAYKNYINRQNRLFPDDW